ncbi:NAD(P)/FAD-dependent oxidoreductase [Marinomonas mediterranea]|jgi:Glycine/D-amino acid oxidases (deaminating)|uniref:FAD dependent oxidoreductase n=1 Tax=Marinomonas mediterranea (strain ATCC 700492 / JCM 21426 / NBRC 103028 / MMB-1) TaxID=717774 RepID=F2JVQ9_MARM1|nr:FAD-binding oxidoreductase [Marinomonas mediterranea]ADZ91695.1 FAD dependent oxidoreductase [Marinomonas mediterranea MMB-1]WCN17791.1 FAD-dependent oxidoreductase [Marinomonas mediterranea MMB-1]
MKLSSYWLDSVSSFSKGEQGSAIGQYDVAIVGAGYTGLSAAVELAKQGVSVVVFEAGTVIGEASGRNGGQCNAGLAHDYGALASKIGKEKATEFYQAYLAAVDTVEQLVTEENIDCDFSRNGRLKLAAKPAHFSALSRAHDRLVKDVDPNVKLLSAEQVREETGTDRFYGGLLQTTSAQMHMGKFGKGLAEAAVRYGAKIFEHAPVSNIARVAGGRYSLTSSRGRVQADNVFLATGSSASGPFQYFRRRLVSVGSFIVVTEPLDQEILTSHLINQRSYVTTKNIGNYFRVTPDNRILFGGRARFAMSSPTSDQKSGRILRKAMIETFPRLKDVNIDYCWGGLVDMTADRLPRAGQHDGMFYSLGYSGHGVQMSTHMGRIMANQIIGQKTTNPWRTLDWPAVPGHFGKPWFLPFVGAYYRFQDMIS